MNDFTKAIQNKIISEFEKQRLPIKGINKIKVRNMVNEYIDNILTELYHDDIVIYGLCEEFKKNKDIY